MDGGRLTRRIEVETGPIRGRLASRGARHPGEGLPIASTTPSGARYVLLGEGSAHGRKAAREAHAAHLKALAGEAEQHRRAEVAARVKVAGGPVPPA